VPFFYLWEKSVTLKPPKYTVIMMALSLTVISSILDPKLDAIFELPADNPFVDRRFLAALEQSCSIGSQESGWLSAHLLLTDGTKESLVLGYLKGHSFGEYVFDWPIAEAYENAGARYYPKWVSAVPFSPISGPRMLGEKVDPVAAAQVLEQWLVESELSGGHLLFSDSELVQGWVPRSTVQFKWRNRAYLNFDDFLAQLKSSKRKTIRKERQRIIESGISIITLVGVEITYEYWSQFYRCYCATYVKRSGHLGYLTEEFFAQLYESMLDQLMLVVALDSTQSMVAGALFMLSADTLYGRYWGALDSYDGLHFECAYYRGIDFAIDQGIKYFDAGVQGEHKLIRGFEPVMSASYHWLSHPAFRRAFSGWAATERQHQQQYFENCNNALPFRSEGG